MCGRFRLSRRKELLAEYFDVNFDDLDWEPRFNVAPTQLVPVIRRRDPSAKAGASLMRWGLIPAWAPDPKVGAGLINARAETAAIKPSFCEPLRTQRCLIPADGFYEWKRTGRERQPYCFEVNSGELFAFAGLWDRWRSPDGKAVETCAILTTTPSEVLADVHDRMPVILPPDHYDRWLDPRMQDAAGAVELLRPFDSNLMRRYPVGTRVNLVVNDGPECSIPVDLPSETISLFD